MKKHILIIGSGSIGQRHAYNLFSLGCKISCCDFRNDRIDEMKSKVEITNSYNSLLEAIEKNLFDGAVICTPTFFHPQQTEIIVNLGIPLLLEKPISKTLKEALKVKEVISRKQNKILLGYTWRWWKPLLRVKKILDKNLIGNLNFVQFHMSAHLADWHPWEPYQEFFMSSKKMGGGALLDESHWIDLMIWFFGMPKSVSGKVSKHSNLEIETDDNVDIICSYKNFNVTIHLDLYGRPHEKFIRFIGDDGSMMWSADPNEISIGKTMNQDWKKETFKMERNDMFMDLAKEFIDFIRNDKPVSCNYEDGIKVMQLIEAVRESSNTGKEVKL